MEIQMAASKRTEKTQEIVPMKEHLYYAKEALYH